MKVTSREWLWIAVIALGSALAGVLVVLVGQHFQKPDAKLVETGTSTQERESRTCATNRKLEPMQMTVDELLNEARKNPIVFTDKHECRAVTFDAPVSALTPIGKGAQVTIHLPWQSMMILGSASRETATRLTVGQRATFTCNVESAGAFLRMSYCAAFPISP